jgi:hypothetical protein
MAVRRIALFECGVHLSKYAILGWAKARNNMYKILRNKIILWYTDARLIADESFKRKINFFTAILGVGLIAGVVGLYGFKAYNAGRILALRPLPPKILIDLPSDVARANIMLRDVLKKKFPPGTPESVVLEGLQKEGFQSGFDNSSRRQYAFFQISMSPQTKGRPCQALCLIDWDLNGDHVIDDFHVSQTIVCGIVGRPPLP